MVFWNLTEWLSERGEGMDLHGYKFILINDLVKSGVR
jgi:hypothetical protein